MQSKKESSSSPLELILSKASGIDAHRVIASHVVFDWQLRPTT
jgi:hypothetical protein